MLEFYSVEAANGIAIHHVIQHGFRPGAAVAVA